MGQNQIEPHSLDRKPRPYFDAIARRLEVPPVDFANTSPTFNLAQISLERHFMGRSGIITFKGNPMTLEGDDLAVGSTGPPFRLHYAQAGIQNIDAR